MAAVPTIHVTNGKQVIRINASEEAIWAERGFDKVKPVQETAKEEVREPKGKRK